MPLLDKMAFTLDLKRQIASFGEEPADPKVMCVNMEDSMRSCATAFQEGNLEHAKALVKGATAARVTDHAR